MILEQDKTGIWLKHSRREEPHSHLCHATKITDKNSRGLVSFAYVNDEEIVYQCEKCNAVYETLLRR